MRVGVKIVINFKSELRNVGKNETCDIPAYHQNTQQTTHTHTGYTKTYIFVNKGKAIAEQALREKRGWDT